MMGKHVENRNAQKGTDALPLQNSRFTGGRLRKNREKDVGLEIFTLGQSSNAQPTRSESGRRRLRGLKLGQLGVASDGGR